MPLHFHLNEFTKRLNRLKEMMFKEKLDGMLLFRQESMFYLTGYDTFGYVFFQCLYFGIDGEFIESQAFAYLAIRSYLKLPISFPETTGVKKPCTGGNIIKN